MVTVFQDCATPHDVDRFWQTFLHRFVLENTFGFTKQIRGWSIPKSPGLV
ncbi:hypothetical protein [Streptomyces sviceus]